MWKQIGWRWRAVIALVACLVGAGACTTGTGQYSSPAATTTIQEATDSTEETTDSTEEAFGSTDDNSDSLQGTSDLTDSSELVALEWDGSAAYVTVGDGVPDFTDDQLALVEAFESYSELDTLGRAGAAFALVGTETMPADGDERGDISEVYPSGWVQTTYEDLIDNGGWLYNRCHLIAWALSDEDANEKNLITGTRYLNTEGMLSIEEQVLEYIEQTGNHVLYRVTPVFDGDNLLASGVRIEAWSVEDAGAGICLDVYCFNVQPGIEIDYATGESELA